MLFGTVVLRVSRQLYEKVLQEERAACGAGDHAQLGLKSLTAIVEKFKMLAEVLMWLNSGTWLTPDLSNRCGGVTLTIRYLTTLTSSYTWLLRLFSVRPKNVGELVFGSHICYYYI